MSARLRMSKQEIVDELGQMEGDPQFKGYIMRDSCAAMLRMMDGLHC